MSTALRDGLDETLVVPFVTYDDYHYPPDSFSEKNATVTFPFNNQYCIVNGRKNYISVKSIKDLGWSSDGLYRRIATASFLFWVNPDDAERLINILHTRRRITEENRRRNEVAYVDFIKNYLIDLKEESIFDQLDESVIWCYIVDGVPDLISGSTKKDTANILKKAAEVCKKHGGRLYRTRNKKAEFAIVWSNKSRLPSSVSKLRQQGFKVAILESALWFMGLDHLINKHAIQESFKKWREIEITSYEKQLAAYEAET
jgi:hypothetical protein